MRLIKNDQNFIKENIDLVNKSKKFILFQTYIFIEDEYTLPFLEALINKAKEGIQIYILIDSLGSPRLSKETLEKFEKVKIHFKYFKPILHFSHLGRRLHQKILIIDNEHLLLGGINYAKKFNAPDDHLPWLDYACLISGKITHEVFLKTCYIFKESFPNSKFDFKAMSFELPKETTQTSIEVKVNDWMRYKQEIYKSYLQKINESNESIYLLATYFIPGKKLLRALKRASKRGVKIHLIFGERSDHPIVDLVCDYYYQWYLDNDIHIYEWDKSVIHAKVSLIDHTWATIGSYNHNYVSQYGNLETNLNICERKFCDELDNELKGIILNSTKITKTNIKRDFYTKLLTKSVYLLTSFIIFISVIFAYKKRE